MSVNVPTNLKVKEKDINAKLQLYGIYSAFAQGKVPSNQQIDVAMNTALEWNGLKTPNQKLSAEGRKLVADLRDVVEKAKVLLLSKNQGNLLQDFIWQTQTIGSGNANGVKAPVDKDTAKQHGQEAVEGLRTLGRLLITNGQFRKLLSDVTVLLRDMAGDAAQKAATKVNPSDEQLAQIDDHADDNTWHDAPDLSKDSLKNRAQSAMPIKKKDAKDAVKDAANQGAETTAPGSTQANDPSAVAQNQNVGSQDAKKGAAQSASALKNKFSNNMDEDSKQKAREYRERTKNYFKEKVPKDRRDNTILRLKKMIVEIQGHQDYQQAIDTLLRLAEEYHGHSKHVASQSQGAVKGVRSQDSLELAETDLKTLLERFANSTSFDDLIDSINQIYTDADRDPELKNWFKDVDRYIRKCLQEQGYVLQDESTAEWNRLYDHGEFLLRERYRNHTDRILDEFKFLANQFDEDAQNKAFADSMNRLFNDLGTDENGNAEFKPHLVKDLTDVLIPAFFENIRYVPIPRIEYSDPMMDAIIENLVIEGDNLAPNVFEFASDNHWHWARKGQANKNKNKVMLSVSGVQMDMRDVAYYVKKKQGFPGVTDRGVMDVFLGGTGLSFKVAMETADPSDRNHFFKIGAVTVDIKHMDIKLKQSNHKTLFKIFKPLLFKVLRPVIQKVAEKQIRDNVSKLDAMLYRVKVEADRAAEEAKNNPDPENVQNIYQRYSAAFQKQLEKGKAKKHEVVDNKTVNVAMTQQDSIFKNIKLPGGISTKATEYKELADKGDKWESPVFSIGSAKGTSNLPQVSEPRRKPHNVTEGRVLEKGERIPKTAADVDPRRTDNFGTSNNMNLGTSNNLGTSTTTNGPTTMSSTTTTANTSTGTTLGTGNPVFSGQA